MKYPTLIQRIKDGLLYKVVERGTYESRQPLMEELLKAFSPMRNAETKDMFDLSVDFTSDGMMCFKIKGTNAWGRAAIEHFKELGIQEDLGND